MISGPVLAALAAVGVALLVVPRRPPRRGTTSSRSLDVHERASRWMAQAGLTDVTPAHFAAVCGGAAGLAFVATWVVFGAALTASAVGVAAALAPVDTYRRRRRARRAAAAEAWPTMIEEIRVLCGAAGRSIPRALLEVGARGPEELRPAFAAARREWDLTTDFERTVEVLKAALDNPTADGVCETLLVAHELGAVDLDRRLAALAEDRRIDVYARRDARAKQAGVRFARRFVVIVPAGMAVAGLSLGDGRAAYQTPTGQVVVAIAVGLVGLCWWWSARLLRLPEPGRVFR